MAASDHEKDHAWLPKERSAQEIASASGTNRWAGWPYTKYMVANDNIDGAACWILCSAKKAREMKIPEEKWAYGRNCHRYWYSPPTRPRLRI